MWLQFLLENAHFAINLLVALVFFAVFWLYFDAWRERKNVLSTLRLVGYLLLSVSFVVSAATVESSILTTSLVGGGIMGVVTAALKIPGYLFLIISLALEPLEKHPEYKKDRLSGAVFLAPFGATLIDGTYFIYPVLAAIVGFFYLRRATVGLEDHLKQLALSFFLLCAAEFLGISHVFTQSNNVELFRLVAPFGGLWIVGHVLLFAVAVVVGKWVFGYLLKQFQTQLFMIFTTTVLFIFLVTTVAFTGLLVRNIETESLGQLETDVKVLDYTLESKKAELISDAQVLAQNPAVISALNDKNRGLLSDIAGSVLLAKNESTVVIANDTGQVLARGEDRDRAGDSLSDDPLMKRAILGESASSVVTHDGVVSPALSLQAATPVRDGDKIIGLVMVGTLVDNAYVDGLKTATGLEAIVYGDNQISAGTLMTPDGKSRLTGIKEEHNAIKVTVLTNGMHYTGVATLLQVPYFASYLPLKDVDGNPVGMLFVGRPQYSVLQAAGRSIELTFLVTVALLVFSIVPAYMISRYIANQL